MGPVAVGERRPPAISLARSGVILPAPQARALVGSPRRCCPGSARRSTHPAASLLEGGDLLHHPGLDVALSILAGEGPDAFYTGRVGQILVDTVRAGGGAIGPADLAAYRVLQVPVERATFAGMHVFARHDLNNTIESPRSRPACLRCRGASEPWRWPGAHRAWTAEVGDTTNMSVVDADGNACVCTLTLGIGSGVWLPGLGVHLNSMLGEGELITPGTRPGDRMSSNMCPLVVVETTRRTARPRGRLGRAPRASGPRSSTRCSTCWSTATT